MKTKTRSVYIDVMKGLLITLVVIGHLPFFEYDSRTLTLIYSFHMPAFLILGGILSHVEEKTTYLDILSKRFKGTLIPYFVFYFISLILVPVDTPDKKIHAIITMFKGIGDPNYAVNLPLWFLTFYFCALTIFELIECTFYKLKVAMFGKKKATKNHKIFFVEFFTFIVVAIIMYFSYMYARVYKGVRLPFNLEISCFCLLFVFFGKIIGMLMKDAIVFIKKNTAFAVFSLLIAMLFVVIFTVIWYVLSMNNGRIDLNARDYKNAFYMYFDAIIGFLIFAFFAYVISYIPIIKNIFSCFGENSLYILAYHVPSTIITQNIIIPLLPASFGVTLLCNSLISVASLTLCGILVSLLLGLIHKLCHFPS